jgi:hypothetical protein
MAASAVVWRYSSCGDHEVGRRLALVITVARLESEQDCWFRALEGASSRSVRREDLAEDAGEQHGERVALGGR